MSNFIDYAKCDSFQKFNDREIDDLIKFLLSFSIPYRNYLNIPSNVTFGIEIEFTKARFDFVKCYLEKNKEKWHLDTEERIQKRLFGNLYGGEAVSPIFVDKSDTWHEIKDLCLALKQMHAKINDYCGGHIHIGSQIMENNKVYYLKLIKLWTIYEHVIYRFAFGNYNRGRKGIPLYAPPVRNEFYQKMSNLNSCAQMKKFNYIHLLKSSVLSDYHGIHFFDVGNKKKDTIEVKCPNGTLSEQIWQNNINFFVKFFLASKTCGESFLEDKLKKYEYISYREYANVYLDLALELSDLIFDNNLDKLCFLKQYLKCSQKNYDRYYHYSKVKR